MKKLPKIKETVSRRGKEMLIVDDIYLFNLAQKNKDNSKLYKCVEYKTDYKCKAFIKIKNNEIISYENTHNHKDKELYTVKEELRKEIKNEIINSNDKFSIKVPRLFKSRSADKGIKGPSFTSIKSTLYNTVSNSLPQDVDSFDNIPEESIYYNTINNHKFLYFKNNRICIFQSDNMAKIHLKYGSKIFCDATFKACPAFTNQLFIIRVYDSIKNSFYTTTFSIIKGKNKDDYHYFFEN